MTKAKSPWLLLALLTVISCPASWLHSAENEDAKAPAALKVEVTGAGRPMILIPGLACGGNVWDSTVAHFKDRYECHVVTLAGFAGQPAIDGQSLPQVRDALSDYIRDRKLDRPVIIGHSLGAFLAFWLAADKSGQTGPIIAVDGVPYYPALLDASTTPQQQQPMATMFRNGLRAQPSSFFAVNNQLTLAGMITNPKDVEMVAALSNKSDPKAVAQALYEILTTDIRDKVKLIPSPVLLIAPTDSSANPEEKQRNEASYRAQVATIPRHEVVFAPNSRHFVQLDAPAFFFQEAESFLKEAESGRK